MASSPKRPTPGQIAQLANRSKLEGRGFKLTLPVKADWPQPLFPIDKRRGAGVDPNGQETREGEQAIARRTLQEVDTAGYSLAELMRDAGKRFGSNQRLAQELVAMEPRTDPHWLEPAPGHKENTRDVAAMLRKVQEWTQGTHKERIEGEWQLVPGPKYANPRGLNKRRVVRLMTLFTVNLSLGVGGWWRITEKDESPRELYMTWNTPGRERTEQGGHTRATNKDANRYIRAARQAILKDGEGFVDLVLLSAQDQFEPYPIELVSVHALFVEMSW